MFNRILPAFLLIAQAHYSVAWAFNFKEFSGNSHAPRYQFSLEPAKGKEKTYVFIQEKGGQKDVMEIVFTANAIRLSSEKWIYDHCFPSSERTKKIAFEQAGIIFAIDREGNLDVLGGNIKGANIDIRAFQKLFVSNDFYTSECLGLAGQEGVFFEKDARIKADQGILLSSSRHKHFTNKGVLETPRVEFNAYEEGAYFPTFFFQNTGVIFSSGYLDIKQQGTNLYLSNEGKIFSKKRLHIRPYELKNKNHIAASRDLFIHTNHYLKNEGDLQTRNLTIGGVNVINEGKIEVECKILDSYIEEFTNTKEMRADEIEFRLKTFDNKGIITSRIFDVKAKESIKNSGYLESGKTTLGSVDI